MTDELAIAKRNRSLAEELESVKSELEQLKSKIEPTSIKSDGYNRCRHVSACIDEPTRIVSCAACGKQLDAVDLLIEFAKKERNLNFSRKIQAELDTEIEKLTKIRNSLRSQVRRKGVQP